MADSGLEARFSPHRQGQGPFRPEHAVRPSWWGRIQQWTDPMEESCARRLPPTPGKRPRVLTDGQPERSTQESFQSSLARVRRAQQTELDHIHHGQASGSRDGAAKQRGASSRRRARPAFVDDVETCSLSGSLAEDPGHDDQEAEGRDRDREPQEVHKMARQGAADAEAVAAAAPHMLIAQPAARPQQGECRTRPQPR